MGPVLSPTLVQMHHTSGIALQCYVLKLLPFVQDINTTLPGLNHPSAGDSVDINAGQRKKFRLAKDLLPFDDPRDKFED